MKYCCHIGRSRPNCSSMACCWSAFRFSLMNAASGVPGISRNMKSRIVVTASSARALCVKRSTISLMESQRSLAALGMTPRAATITVSSRAQRGTFPGSFRRQLFLLARRVVELAADHAISAVLEDLLGFREACLHLVDRGVVPEGEHRRDVAVGGVVM